MENFFEKKIIIRIQIRKKANISLSNGILMFTGHAICDCNLKLYVFSPYFDIDKYH